MANFLSSYKKTAAIEAGYTVDNGGATYKGIAFKNWKTDPLAMSIYKTVIAAKPAKKQIIINPDLDKKIFTWYKINYWDKVYGDRITNQVLADFIYDFYVNSNSAPAIINQAIGTRGSIGFTESTLKQLNDKAAYCYTAIRDARKAWYDRLARRNNKFKTNGTYKGWVARINTFPQAIATVSGIGSTDSKRMFKKLMQHELRTLPAHVVVQARNGSAYRNVLASHIARKYNYPSSHVENYLRKNN